MYPGQQYTERAYLCCSSWPSEYLVELNMEYTQKELLRIPHKFIAHSGELVNVGSRSFRNKQYLNMYLSIPWVCLF